MTYDVTIDRLPTDALFDLKGPANALADWARTLPAFPKRPNSLTRDGACALCHTGPNRYLLRAPLDQEAQLDADLRPTLAPPEISIVRTSDTQTFFRLTGPDAAQVLAIGCPLDLHETRFLDDSVSYTEFFALKALVMRTQGGFDVAVEQSFGDMIADYLARATA